MKYWASIVLATALFSSVGGRASTHAQERLCFSETGNCISGRFLQYWQQNGGLSIFGFPVTPERPEQNADTGKTYVTQWFERNRFELHPELVAPYDVLLGRLGSDRLGQMGINWQAAPRESGPKPGCQWFEQTGHNVCNQEGASGFRSYWEGNGLLTPGLDRYQRSLALFGLPLTALRSETNTSGDTVLTQWFERARLEWHPDKPAAYKVLLGLLGNDVQRGSMQGDPKLVDIGVSPSVAVAGNQITLSYTIQSPRAEQVTLGASLRQSGNGPGTWFADTPRDTVVNLSIGTNVVTRPFIIPGGQAPGRYDVAWGVWQARTGQSYAYTERGAILSVVAPAGP